MQKQNKFIEDMSTVFQNFMAVAQGSKSEAEAAFAAWLERFIAAQNLVSRSEFEATQAMAVKALESVDALEKRVEELEKKLSASSAPKAPRKPRASAKKPSPNSEKRA